MKRSQKTWIISPGKIHELLTVSPNTSPNMLVYLILNLLHCRLPAYPGPAFPLSPYLRKRKGGGPRVHSPIVNNNYPTRPKPISYSTPPFPLKRDPTKIPYTMYSHPTSTSLALNHVFSIVFELDSRIFHEKNLHASADRSCVRSRHHKISSLSQGY